MKKNNKHKRKVVCIIQARMGSTRLPGKSMMLLGGKPLVEHVLERAKLAKLVEEVVLATSTKQEDDVLAEVANLMGISVFRGHPEDLVDRYYHAAIEFGADIIVRIPADNPLIHPTELDRIIEYFLTNNVDFASNIGPFLNNGYPDGLGAEVFKFSMLEKLYLEIDDPYHREHITTYFRENPHKFRLSSVKCPEEFSRTDIVLDINTKEEYEFMAQLFRDLSRPNHLIHITEVISWYDSTPMRR